MTTNRTLRSLAILLTSTPEQLHFIKRMNDAMKSECRPPLGARLICKVLQIDLPTSLKDLVLSTNKKWEERLERFLANFTDRRIEWICEVRATEWNEQNWGKKAVGLHLGAESVGIFATTSFAVIAASMQLQGFRQPPELPRLLWLAKQLPVEMPIADEETHEQQLRQKA